VEDLDRLYCVNVRSPFVLTQAVLPLLKTCAGQVVFVNSSIAFHPARAGNSIDAASKHAVRAIADGLRAEVNVHGVRVLSVYPGRTATRMQEQIHAFEGALYEPHRLIQPEDIASIVIRALAAPRSVEITDILLRPMAKPAGLWRAVEGVDLADIPE
jgi:NADP-dependent 3-hydroxy acid dehydrogenase YdfG